MIHVLWLPRTAHNVGIVLFEHGGRTGKQACVLIADHFATRFSLRGTQSGLWRVATRVATPLSGGRHIRLEMLSVCLCVSGRGNCVQRSRRGVIS